MMTVWLSTNESVAQGHRACHELRRKDDDSTWSPRDG